MSRFIPLRLEALVSGLIIFENINSTSTIYFLGGKRGGGVCAMGFVAPVMEHWLERAIAQLVHHEGSI